MKKIISFLLFTISISFLAQESINFEKSSFKDILAKAKTQKKLVFLDAYASWCGPCKMMEKNIFPLQSVREFFNANFINASIDMEKGEGREIARKYNIYSYPTYLFLNGDGEVVIKDYGYKSETDFLDFAKEANNPKLKKGSYKELFANGEKDPELLLNMMRTYADSDPEFSKKVSERYFQVKGKQPLTPEELRLLLYYLKSTEDQNYKIFIERKDEISQMITPEKYREIDSSLKISKVFEAAFDEKTGTIDDEKFLQSATPLIGKAEAENELSRFKVNYFANVGNFAAFEKAALAYYTDPEKFTPDELIKAAWVFSEHVSDPKSLKKAVEWAEKANMNIQNPQNTYILAKLYAKTGNKDGALLYAKLSKYLAESQGLDSSLANQLLETLK
ncbi:MULTISPECIES: thioredoxin family protein [Chryseobacterium]|uniref:thioredoxin family protein n=1 Tax=Chryseobacterium sp. R2A-55 TaxID=2744445 RepID=UPI001F158B18|nr:thioredoxin fold domain-containing protein [Chryseobacterium sp. R2A-55]